MAGKFEKQADLLMQDIENLFNRQLRRSLRAALRAAIRTTEQDSSNAAAHWMIAENRYSRPRQRAEGTVRDLRGRKGGRKVSGGVTSPSPGKNGVGLRGDKGKNRTQVLNTVMAREEGAVISRYAKGSKPARVYTLFHGTIEGLGVPYSASALAQYAARANIQAAGEAGVAAFMEAMTRYTAEGKVRR